MYEEQWRAVKDFDNYEVSSSGRIRNKKTKRVLATQIGKNGYNYASLRKDGKYRGKGVGRLVAEAFIEESGDGKYLRHIDGNKSNNYVSNLKYIPKQPEKHESKYRIGKINRIVDDEGNEYFETLRKGLKVWVVDTNYVYDTIKDCAEDIGLTQREVAEAINNKELTRTGLTIKLSTY